MKINPIDIQALNYIQNFNLLNTENAKDNIKECLVKYCSYNGIHFRVPINMGKLLAKYAVNCNYSIRSNIYDVDVVKQDEGYDNIYTLAVYWITESYIFHSAAVQLCYMFEDLMKLTIAQDFEVRFYCGCKFNYSLRGKTPTFVLLYDPQTKSVDIVENHVT